MTQEAVLIAPHFRPALSCSKAPLSWQISMSPSIWAEAIFLSVEYVVSGTQRDPGALCFFLYGRGERCCNLSFTLVRLFCQAWTTGLLKYMVSESTWNLSPNPGIHVSLATSADLRTPNVKWVALLNWDLSAPPNHKFGKLSVCFIIKGKWHM